MAYDNKHTANVYASVLPFRPAYLQAETEKPNVLSCSCFTTMSSLSVDAIIRTDMNKGASQHILKCTNAVSNFECLHLFENNNVDYISLRAIIFT